MNDSMQIPHPHGDPNNDDTGGHGRRPYWKRAHRDWRIWFCTIMMLAAMLAYVATGGLRWRIQVKPQQPQQPMSVPSGN